MRLLLDTHIAIWSVGTTHRIKPHVRDLLDASINTAFVSAVSIWEIAIKHSLGKRSAPPFSADKAIRLFEEAGYKLLDMTPEHAVRVASLPKLHGDPFDRLLVAQATSEPMYLLTADRRLFGYGPTVIPC